MNDKAFGRFVEQRRKAADMTMRDFADKVGITAPYLSDIEKGRRSAPDSKLEIISEVLRLSREETAQMYDLAAQTRENQAPADLTDYINETEKARVALRRAKERQVPDSKWDEIISIIEEGA